MTMDRRKRKTQTSIIHAFYTLIEKEDFEQVTVSQICTLADINRGTFYLNYLDKYDLLEKIITDEIDHLINFCSDNEQTKDHLTLTLEYLLLRKNQFRVLLKADTSGIFNSFIYHSL